MKAISQRLRACVALLSLLLLTFALLPSASAQETTGAIQGTVTDPSGAVVAGATVTATGNKLIQPATSTTDARGFYRLNALPSGNYTITVNGGGMSSKATDLNLTAGALPNLNFKLTAGAETVIDVSTAVALVDVTQSKVETTITNELLQQIPKGRSFQSVIPFAPGARQEPLQSTTGGVLNGNRTGGFQIDGASDSENVYSTEGVNITALSGGGVGYNVPIEFVQDVQIKSSSFQAEFGGALGGVVSVIQAKGGNDWHGSVLMYYRSSAFNANDQCNFFAACGVRKDPTTTLKNPTTADPSRKDQTLQYFVGQQDHYRTVNPGFTIGGSLYPKRVWLFASYIPEFFRIRRSANFTKTNPGPRTFYQSQDQHYGFARLDYAPISKLRLFASWEDLYTRQIGTLPNPDSVSGLQLNTSSTIDPTSFRADTGIVAPQAVYAFGGDYTVTSKMLLSVRYGYLYSNQSDRGKPTGIRYLLGANASTGNVGLDGTVIPSGTPYSQGSAYNNISSNQQNLFNVLSRKSLSADVSYLKTGLFGTHNFKGGYAQTTTYNNILSGYNTAEVDLFYGQAYSVGTSATACDAIIAANQAKYGSGANTCRGNFGYFTIHDGVDNGGIARGSNHAFYFQDDWTVGKTGLTLNLGVRFDNEYLPPYSPGASSIGFGFGDKIAPRIGGAYDVLHNGKLKVYASYGKFYDIIKYSLPSGSFGGQYWHDCTYALDDPDFTKLQPTAPGGHGCPASGPAPGIATSNRFIENLDFRKNIINTQDPGVDPHPQPMSQHEFVVGADWAIKPSLSFSARYARKRLDNTIEDIGATDALGFYIGNPGPGYGDTLHRTLYAAGFTSPLCTACPLQPKAKREYDGLEFSVTKTAGSHYFFKGIYTYSRLQGNYPGLTSTFSTDGGGGRHSPNNNRSFDQPQMAFTAHGQPFGGPLPTDRPNTFQAFGSYRLKFFHTETQLGISQAIFQGTPVSTAVPTLGTTSSVQFVEDQGNFVPFTTDALGNLIAGPIQRGRRTPAYTQTDASFTYYVHVSPQHENRKLGMEANFYNLLNQHAITQFNEVVTTAATAPPSVTSNPTGFDFLTLTTNFDYTSVINNKKNILSSTYNQPSIFQSARQIRLKIAYTF